MSRIGKKPITIPAGVALTISGNDVMVKGPLGQLSQKVNGRIKVRQEDGKLILERSSDDKEDKAMHGLYRMLIYNMVEGVTKGFTKQLVVNGVGYKVQKQGNKLVLNIGYSHPVEYTPPEGITIDCPTQTEITVKGISKELVGQVAANIRAFKKPDPYHFYGIRYKDEVIQKKEGKTAGK
ncbi:MAG: 50S ribosomal protein L6 [Clostridiales bacterium]|jgi:large subunit ribosomal protein L6|nr:50S ribosomal protein L6 [Clostridiales bacterium]